MSIATVEPPAPIVTLAEAKRHLRLEDSNNEDDELVTGLIAAVTSWIDGPEGWVGRCFGRQVHDVSLDRWPQSPPLVGPVSEILNLWGTVDGELREVDVAGVWLSDDGRLMLTPSAVQAGLDMQAPVTVRVSAGGEVPAAVKQAALLIVGSWFRVRESENVGNIVNEMPWGAEVLLSTYRTWRA